MNRKQLATSILKILKDTYPDAKCELIFNNNFELLVATILSAQCTDVMVNKVTPKLFSAYPTPDKLGQASVNAIEKIIKPTGFYKNKAKNIHATSKILSTCYDNNVPNTMDDLLKLPGVGRKTANVVLSNGFDLHQGIVVDTHVKRISNLLNLTKSHNPVTIENDLMTLFKRDNWGQLSHLFIAHGRKICTARKPQCQICKINKYCFFFGDSQTKS